MIINEDRIYQPQQGLVSDSHRLVLRNLNTWHRSFDYRMPSLHDSFRSNYNFGPRAPKRKRPKRLAKKLALRGGMLRCRGPVQSLAQAWPEMRRWFMPRAKP
jgi:hypothetical protein